MCFSTMAQQDLYGVTKDGKFYKGTPPQDASDSWLDRADYIGYGDWKDFRHLFFHPDGTLYGVLNGKFYKAHPPLYATDNWLARATLVGSGGWDVFQFLFFDPEGMLYGVTGDFLYKRLPPTDSKDSWLANVLEQADGPTLSSSCSIHTGPYSASISVAISTGGPRPQRRMKTGPFETSHPRAITMTSIAFFSSWRMVNCV